MGRWSFVVGHSSVVGELNERYGAAGGYRNKSAVRRAARPVCGAAVSRFSPRLVDLDGMFVLTPMVPMVPELAREIERARIEAGLNTD